MLFVCRICLAVLALSSIAQAESRWPAFQGPPADELRPAELPLNWSPTENMAWRAEIPGYGQSSPVAWDGQVFVTSISGEMKENGHICAYDLQSGEKRWQHDFTSASQAENNNYVSKAAPSPVVDDSGVIALFEGGSLIALTHDGKVRWQRNFVTDYGKLESRHGLASSLEQNDEHVFVWMERQDEPYALAVSKADGETAWKAKGLGVTSWSSPRLAPVGDSMHLVLSGIGKLAGLDPQTGKRLWEFDDISGNSTPTPLPLGEGRLLIGATEGRGQASGGAAAESNGVVQVKPLDDGGYEVKYAWRASRATSSFGSPIAHQGYAYFVNRAGVVYCLDLQTGDEQYAKRTSGSVWATPLAVEDRIYLFGREGTTTVIKAGPEFEVLAENPAWKSGQPAASSGAGGFGGPVLYAAIVVDDTLVLRQGDALYAVRKAP